MSDRIDVKHELSDEDLMARVQQGDAAAYQQLFHRYQDQIYGYLIRRTRNPELARDLFQETFLSIHRARDTWQPGRTFRPWLYGIATNAVRDTFRKASRRPHEVELDRPVAIPSGSPVGVMHLERALDELPETLRDAFLLGAVEGFDHREVAEQLGIKPDAARARISRARAQLRKILDPEEGT